MEMEREYEMGKRALWLNKHKHCINEPEISIHSPCVPSSCCFFPFFFISTYIHQLPLFVCLRDANSLSHTCTRTNDFLSPSLSLSSSYSSSSVCPMCAACENIGGIHVSTGLVVCTGCVPVLVISRWCLFQKRSSPEKHTFPWVAVGFPDERSGRSSRERVVMAMTLNF